MADATTADSTHVTVSPGKIVQAAKLDNSMRSRVGAIGGATDTRTRRVCKDIDLMGLGCLALLGFPRKRSLRLPECQGSQNLSQAHVWFGACLCQKSGK